MARPRGRLPGRPARRRGVARQHHGLQVQRQGRLVVAQAGSPPRPFQGRRALQHRAHAARNQVRVLEARRAGAANPAWPNPQPEGRARDAGQPLLLRVRLSLLPQRSLGRPPRRQQDGERRLHQPLGLRDLRLLRAALSAVRRQQRPGLRRPARGTGWAPGDAGERQSGMGRDVSCRRRHPRARRPAEGRAVRVPVGDRSR
jgi:hypothetical protein